MGTIMMELVNILLTPYTTDTSQMECVSAGRGVKSTQSALQDVI